MHQKISAHIDGGLSGGSRVRRPLSEDPHRRERKVYDSQFGGWSSLVRQTAANYSLPDPADYMMTPCDQTGGMHTVVRQLLIIGTRN